MLLNDTVYVEKPDGRRTGPFKAAIGNGRNGGTASIFDENLDVEEGCKLIRSLPNGKNESYTILETHYSPGNGLIPKSWKLKLKKDGSLINRQTVSRSTTVNISNSQGIQVGDHNSQNIEIGLKELIQSVSGLDIPPQEKEQASSLIKQLVNNPTIAGVLGGATSGLLSLL